MTLEFSYLGISQKVKAYYYRRSPNHYERHPKNTRKPNQSYNQRHKQYEHKYPDKFRNVNKANYAKENYKFCPFY